MIPRRQARQECADFWICVTFALGLILGGLYLLDFAFGAIDGSNGWLAWSACVFLPAGFVLLTAGTFFAYAARASWNIWRGR